jgi:hypothetical protein
MVRLKANKIFIKELREKNPKNIDQIKKNMWKFKIEGLKWKEITLIQKSKRKQKYKLRTKLKTIK